MADGLRPGDELPDFDGVTLDGRTVNYRRDLWQKKFVVLVAFASPASADAQAYRSALLNRERELTSHETALLFLAGGKDGAPSTAPVPVPSVVIADRWGEVRDVQHPADERGLPAPDAIVEWLRFVQVECPECEGETK